MSAALSITAFDHTTSQLTITGHGLHTGDGPAALWNVGGVLPVGLAPVTDVFVINVDANTLKLAASSTLAFANTPLTFADNGSGTSTLLIGVPYRRPRTYAQGVRIASADLNANFDTLGSFAWPFLTGQPQSLLDGPTFSGPLVVGGQLLPFADFTFTAAGGSSAVLTAAAHPLHTGAGPIRGSNGGGGLPGGFPAATDLWAIKLSSSTFSVATSLANALAGTAVAMSTVGTGTQTINHQPTTTRISDATVTRNLTVGSQLTVAGRKAALNGTIMVPVVPPTVSGAVTQLAATVSGTGGGTHPLLVPLPVVVGNAITGLRARIIDSATGPTTLTMTISTTTDGSLNFSAPLATSNTSLGTAAEQTLTVTAALVVQPLTQYWAIIQTTTGSANCTVHRMELDMPPY